MIDRQPLGAKASSARRESAVGSTSRWPFFPSRRAPAGYQEGAPSSWAFAVLRCALCEAAPNKPAPGFNRGQAEAGADLQAGRPLLAAHPHRRGDFRATARPGEPREISVAHATAPIWKRLRSSFLRTSTSSQERRKVKERSAGADDGKSEAAN
jgi:hypothetical protein